MGVVHRAEDLRLYRLVALKFLSDGLARGPAALERFPSEAEVASALNHPNICTVHDIGEENCGPFTAIEFWTDRWHDTQCIGPQPTPLLIHLLAPNYRAVQTTTDLWEILCL
jgi:serine/threonine protein kinase